MARWYNQTGREKPLQSGDFTTHFGWTAGNQKVLSIDTAAKGCLMAKFRRQSLGFHVLGQRLNRMNCVDAQRDQIGNHIVNAAAAMVDHLQAVAVDLIDEPLDAGKNKLAQVSWQPSTPSGSRNR